jgi:hypothetical protein
LIWNVLVDGNEDVETSGLGSLQQAPILQSRQIGESGSLAVVPGEQKP